MSERKRGRPAKPVQFGLPDWTPLKAAFVRIRDCVGDRDLAARDLHRDLVNGRLPSAKREFDRHGAEIQAGILESDYWQQFTFTASPIPILPIGSPAIPDPGMVFRLRDATVPRATDGKFISSFPWWEAHFFVRSAELDRFYRATGTPENQPDPMEPPRRLPGPPPDKYDWFAICGEIARRCVDPKTKRVRVPKRENKLAEAVGKWCGDKYSKRPTDSEMRVAVKTLCAALREFSEI